MHDVGAGRQHQRRRRRLVFLDQAEFAAGVGLGGIDAPGEPAADRRRIVFAETRIERKRDLRRPAPVGIGARGTALAAAAPARCRGRSASRASFGALQPADGELENRFCEDCAHAPSSDDSSTETSARAALTAARRLPRRLLQIVLMRSVFRPKSRRFQAARRGLSLPKRYARRNARFRACWNVNQCPTRCNCSRPAVRSSRWN